MAIRVTTTGQTTFVKKVVIGTPVRSVTGTGASFTTLNDVTITNASQKQIITFDSAQQKFINTDSATLVNLTVSGNILPATDSASDLGSATKKFKDLFLSGSTITLGTLRLKDSGGGLAVADSAGQEKPLSLEGSKSQIRSFFSSGGDISYDSSKGQFSIDVETVYTKANFDSDLGAALSGGTGITYDSSSDTISLTNTSVTAATYGSTTQVPQIAVNAQGQITGASNVAIAHDNLSGFVANEHIDHSGVSITAGNGLKGGGTIASTRDLAIDSAELLALYEASLRHDNLSGFVANEHIDHTSVSIATGTGLSGGGTIASTRTLKIDSSDLASLYSKVIAHDNTSGFVADEHVAHSNVSVVAGKGLSGGGTIASSRTIDIDSANVRGMLSGGTGITYNSSTGAISTTDTDINHDNLSGFVANEHIDHSTVSVTAGKGLSGGGTIASTRTIDIDSANVRGMFSGSNGISYSASTGDIRAPQPLDSAANPTFNQLRGPATFVIDPAAIGDSTGTVKIMGNLQVEGTQTTINSSTIVLKDKNIVIADSAVDSSALNGAGFTWGDSAIVNNPTFNYSHSNARLEANRPISATSFVGNLTGNASGTAATVTNAAQTNITSLGTLTGLTVNGDVAFDSAGGILFDVSDKALEIGAGYKISGLKTTDSAIIGGDGSTGGVTISDGLVDIRSNTGNVSKVKFYCEVSNAHFQTLQAAPHAAGSSAVIVLPTASGTLLNQDGSGASLTSLNASQLSSGTVPSARLSLSASDIPNLAASKITSGTISSDRLSLSASDIPNLATSKITSGTFDSARIPVLAINASNITGGTIASARLSLSASDIPNLSGAKITSGTVAADRIAELGASKITSGSFADARIPNLAASKITSGTFDSARIPAIQINANRITSGTIDSSRLPAGTFGGGGGGGGIDSAAVLTVAGTGIFNTTGEAATAATAGTATNVTVTANNTNNETVYLTFVDGASGTQGIETDTGLTYNPLTHIITLGTGGDNVTFNDDGTITANGNSLKLKSAASAVSLLHTDGNTKLSTASFGVQITGTAAATTFSGSGASLTNIPAGQLTGTISSDRLSLSASDIPNLAASKITSGTFDSARVPIKAISTSNVTSGVFDSARIPNAFTETLEFNPGTAAYDPSSSGSGTDTATDVAISLASGAKIAGHHSGYIRTLLEWNTGSTIEIGQNNTALINHTKIYGGTSGGVELYEGTTKRIETSSSGATVTGTLTATTFSGSGASLTSIPAGQLTGSIDAARITNVAASAITSGTIDSARMPAGTFGGGGGGTADAIAADNIQVGDAAINLTTSAGNITIDAQGNDTDIIFKGTDGGNDRTFLTIDGSEAGKATFLSEIVSTGLEASGDVSIDSAGGFLFDVSEKTLVVGDDYSITLGSSNDFVMKHVGSSGQTVFQENNASGSFVIKAANLQIQNASGSEVMADFNINGAVELYHDNSKKLETASGGVTITGTATATTFSGSGASLTNIPMGQATGTLAAARVGELAASKITSGTFDSARIPVMAINASNITAGTIASARLSLSASDIPNLAASKITSGTISNDRISLTAGDVPNLAASKITSGTFDSARIPVMAINASNITAGTIADARLPASISSDITGNAATATALETARNIGGVSFDGTASINLPGVNTAGNQNTSGTAAIATSITATANNSTDETVYLTFVDGATGTQGIETDTGLSYNPSTGTITSTTFSGALSGNATTATTATTATNVTASANNSSNETVYLTFVDGATGAQGIETDTGLTYNPSTGNITATKFTGDGSALTGISAGVSDGIFLEYQKRVTSSYNIDAGVTALTACNDSDGIEIISGVTVTVSDSSGWVITGGDKNMGLDAMIGASNQTERTMRTGTIKPTLNNTYDLGDSAVAWRNIYTNDLNLSNETGPGNDVDGTTGKWTIQEGEENLYIINRKTGKKYKFMLEEIV